MYLKRIHNVNVGPIEDAEIIFPFDEKNNPKPVIIVGENDTGKSVLYYTRKFFTSRQSGKTCKQLFGRL